MPRLPTMRVIGSHDISTSLRVPVCVSRSGVVTVAIGVLLLVVRCSLSVVRCQKRQAVLLGPRTTDNEQRTTSSVSPGLVSRGELAATVTPPGFLVDGFVGHAAQPANDTAIHPHQTRGHGAAGR